METTIEINGKEHKFRLSAASTYIYHQKFGKDLLREFKKMRKNKKGDLDDGTIDTLSEVAYIAAKQADLSVPDDVASWLDQFDLLDYYQLILPEVFRLWQKTTETKVAPKKQ